MPLHPDQAKERLDSWKDKKGQARCLARVRKLPKMLAAAAFGLLGRTPEGKELREWDKSRAAARAAVPVVDGLSPAQREKLFAAFFPHLARYLARTWDMFPRLPYQEDSDRKAFRAPKNPAAYHDRRASWFQGVCWALEDFTPDVVTLPWVATWAAYLHREDDLGLLLAAGIDAGGPEGKEAFDILTASAAGRHEVGAMGRHVTRALLACARPDAWEFAEKTLLAAQRQEGLRQAILETVDEAHPEAFRRMLRLILEKDLVRFSSVVRAVDVWFGETWGSLSAGQVKKAVARMSSLLDDPKARAAAVADRDPEAVFYGLVAVAFDDVTAAFPIAGKLLKDRTNNPRRLAVLQFLDLVRLPAGAGPLVPHLLPLLADPDLPTAVFAMDVLRTVPDDELNTAAPDLFERLESMVARVPAKPLTVEVLRGGNTRPLPGRDDLAELLNVYLGERPRSRLVPHLKHFGPWARARQVEELARGKAIDEGTRQLFLELVADPHATVREAALKAVAKCKPGPNEVRALEPLLTRKTEGVRRGVLTVLRKQRPPQVLATADRLLGSKNGNVRLAGLELLRQLADDGNGVSADARLRAEAFRDAHPRVTADERRQLEHLLRREQPPATGPHDAFGLGDLSGRTVAPKPLAKKVKFIAPTAARIIQALDQLVHEHREEPVRYKNYAGEQEEPLGAVGWGFPSPDRTKPAAEDAERLPLREVWEEFWTNRPKELRDPDGFELTRALAIVNLGTWEWEPIQQQARNPALKALKELVFGDFKPKEAKYHGVVRELVDWLHRLHPPAGEADYLLDGLETVYARLPVEALRVPKKKERLDPEVVDFWRESVDRLDRNRLTSDQKRRLWQLQKWWDEPDPGNLPRRRVRLNTMLDAVAAGWATETDLLDLLLGVRDLDGRYHDPDDDPLLSADYDELREFTARTAPPQVRQRPGLAALADRIRARLLDLELARGESPTPATVAATHLGALFGAGTLLKLLAALGDKPFKPAARWAWRTSLDRTGVLTRLVENTHPAADDAPDAVADALRAAVAAGAFPQDRLLELAFLAPQWLPHVEKALGWAGVTEGVWWFLAHMPSGNEGVVEDETDAMDPDDSETDGEEKPERLSAWERLIRQRTPLTEEERSEGGVDVQWFHRTHAAVGPDHWDRLVAAARYGGSGQGHKKPTFLADVLLGRAKKADIVAAIAKRRLRESVRLLGLMPLAAGPGREADLRERYEVLQEYLRYARGLGSMSRASAIRAAEIGIANLARTAGFPDSIRFEWEMEAQSVADLAAGPQSVTVQGVTVTLALEDGKPVLTVAKGGKPLKTVPPAAKKHPTVAEFAARKQHLTRQGSRVRKSLEAMMCRGDAFTGDELKKLMAHPLVAPSLARLVLVGEGIAGYPVEAGKALERHDGKLEPVKPAERLRIAHPTDLFATDEWDRWQHDVFARERVQPFKQVFRELYLLTAQERADGNVSHRYAGQQVQPRQGAALLNGRGWSIEDYTRTFHEADVRATFTVRYGGGTALDVEGWTLEDVRFYRRNEYKPMPLADVPPRVFSEAMRDLDLVVSVAHAGQVDPEASASTVEMRASLLRETSQLLRLGNVRIDRSHAFIDGKLGQYSVHLGSGSVHRLPGGSVCIVPVHAQHRGRLFLPFADDDPRTAEVTSKVLLLARDNEIQDPSILQQLLHA